MRRLLSRHQRSRRNVSTVTDERKLLSRHRRSPRNARSASVKRHKKATMKKALSPSANVETRSTLRTRARARDGGATSELVHFRKQQGGVKKADAPLVGGRLSLPRTELGFAFEVYQKTNKKKKHCSLRIHTHGMVHHSLDAHETAHKYTLVHVQCVTVLRATRHYVLPSFGSGVLCFPNS